MAGPIVVAIDGDNRGLSTAIGSSQSKLRGLGSVAGKVGRVVGAGLVVAGAAVVALGVKSVQAASDAQQSLGATETVFGKFAGTVVRDSKRAATTFGLSANDYRESANLIGSLFMNQGVQADKLAGKTRGMIKVGSDLAATYGGTTAEAVEALGSAFKGEFDPMERYGISIKQSAINAELAAHGQEKLEGQALKTAQQIATSKLIMEQSSRAAGAFGRETNTLAHVQQVLGAQSENLQAKIGGALTPSLTKLGNSISANVMPALSDLADKYAPKVAGWIEKIADKIPELIAGFRGSGTGAGDFGDDLHKIGDDLGKIGPKLSDASHELPSLSDGLKVAGVATGFLADHTEAFRKALPYVVAGLVAYKGAQLANQLVGRDSLAGFALQIGSTRSLTIANRQLAASLQGVTTASGGTVTGAGAAATKVSKFGSAARFAGGAAGIGLLTAGMSSADKKTGALMTTLGGAATGFAVGGPWGAAIGGAAGLIASVTKNTGDARQATFKYQQTLQNVKPIEQARESLSGLKDSLDQVTGAYTDSTRAAVLQSLQSKGLISQGAEYGISARTMINAVMGQAGSLRELQPVMAGYRDQISDIDKKMFELGKNRDPFSGELPATLQKQYNALLQHKNALNSDLQSLRQFPGVLRRQGAEIRATTRATQDYTGKLRGIPKRIRSKIEADGIGPTTKGVAAVAAKYKLIDKREIRALIKASGADTTVKAVRRVIDGLESVKDSRANVARWIADVTSGAGRGRDSAKRGSDNVKGALEAGPKSARGDLSNLIGGISTGLTQARSKAGESRSIGASLATGLAGGISDNAWQAVNAAAAMVENAIAEARRRADSHSPSRKTKKLGEDMARGTRDGLRKKAHEAQRAASKLIAGALRGMLTAYKEGAKPLAKQFEQLHKLIRKNDRIGGAGHDSALIKRLHNEEAELRTVTNRYATLGKTLRDARAELTRLRELQRDTTQAAIDAANVTAIGGEAGLVTSGSIIQGMLEKLEATKAFNANIATLTAAGLNKTALQQLISAGVEAGSETAHALVAGGKTAIRDLNELQSQLRDAAGNLGVNAGKAMHEGGVKSAEQFVAGLESQQRRLERAARKIANSIAKQLRGGKAGKLVRAPKLDLIEHTHAATRKRAQLTRDAKHSSAQPRRVTVTLTAEQTSQLQRGKQIRLDLDAYEGEGGRKGAQR